MTHTTAPVELSEVIEGLRCELEKAQELGKGKAIRFGINDIELELNLTIAKKVKGGAKATGKAGLGESVMKYLVGKVDGQLTLSGEGEFQKVSEQKIKLSLSAKNNDISESNDSNSDDSDVYLSGDDR